MLKASDLTDITTAAGSSTTTTQAKQPMYCTDYCDQHNDNVKGFNCNFTSPYCCGNANDKFCCDDSSLIVDVDKRKCYSESNNYYTYLLLSITLTTVVVVVATMLGLCIYYGVLYIRRSRSSTVRMEITDIPAHRPEDFNPLSPSAFFPPPYLDSDKDPPAYEDLMGERILPPCPDYSNEDGNTNMALVGEEEAAGGTDVDIAARQNGFAVMPASNGDYAAYVSAEPASSTYADFSNV